MRAISGYIIMTLLVFTLQGCLDSYKPQAVMKVEDDRIIVILDRRWDSLQVNEIINRYDLDSNLIAAAYSNQNEYISDSIIWKIRAKGSHLIELTRQLDSKNMFSLKVNDIMLFEDLLSQVGIIPGKNSIVFGFNNLEKGSLFNYKDSMALFVLEGYNRAHEVHLSGSFNSWSTSANPMYKTDSGWIAEIKLLPGRYTYKYIVDGRWILDPFNSLTEREDNRGKVSVIYCTNHLFSLDGYPEARNIVVTGNFLNWDTKGKQMTRMENRWVLPVYLRDGTYTYKFIVDGEWITDPSNPDMRSDADGNMNSFVSLGEKQNFRLKGFEDADKVVITGSFNNWRENELLMTKEDGGWSLDYALPSGNYEYKFIVDGRWMPDPEDPLTTGSGDYTNSFISINPNFTFSLDGYKAADNVIATGSFNGWSEEKYRMKPEESGWQLPLYLEPGKYTYKFIVDGEWILDPANDLWEENEYGTGNSVLWVEP